MCQKVHRPTSHTRGWQENQEDSEIDQLPLYCTILTRTDLRHAFVFLLFLLATTIITFLLLVCGPNYPIRNKYYFNTLFLYSWLNLNSRIFRHCTMYIHTSVYWHEHMNARTNYAKYVLHNYQLLLNSNTGGIFSTACRACMCRLVLWRSRSSVLLVSAVSVWEYFLRNRCVSFFASLLRHCARLTSHINLVRPEAASAARSLYHRHLSIRLNVLRLLRPSAHYSQNRM